MQTGQVIINDRWADILGWPPAALGTVTNQFREDLAHPDELASTQTLLREHFAGRSEAYLAEVRLRHQQGHWVWVEERGHVVSRTPEGRPEWVFGILVDIGARRLRDESLRHSEALLQRTGEVGGVGGWEFDVGHDRLSWSAQARRIHGVADDYQPTLGAAIEFYAPDARPLIQAALDDGRSWDLELPFTQAGGRQLQLRSIGHAEMKQGKAVRLIGAFQDVTEAVEQRRALQAAHQRMSLAADSGAIGIWDIDLARQQLTLDSWMVRLYGLPQGHGSEPSELWSRHVHPDDRAAVGLAVAQAIERQRTMEIEFRIIWRDGSVHHMKVSARITRDEHGQALNMIGASWDVTSLRQLSRDLAEQHELLRVTLQSIGDAVITTDAQGRITWLNPVAERMTGWLVNEAQGLPLTQVFHIVNEETRQLADNPVAACLQQGQVVGLANHTVLIARDGSERGIEDILTAWLARQQWAFYKKHL